MTAMGQTNIDFSHAPVVKLRQLAVADEFDLSADCIQVLGWGEITTIGELLNRAEDGSLNKLGLADEELGDIRRNLEDLDRIHSTTFVEIWDNGVAA